MTSWLQTDPAPITFHAVGLGGLGTASAGVLANLPVYITVFAAIVASVSYAVTIWESTTIQYWVAKWKQRRQARKMLKLKSRQRVVNAQIEAMERVQQVKTETHEQVQVAKAIAADELKGGN